MVVPLLLMVIVLLVLALSLLLQGDKRFSVFEFYSRGKELGFSLGECRLIRETLTLAGIKDPVAVFWSIRDLDQCIRAFTKRFKAEGKDKDRVTIAFMEKLYDYRKKLEFDLPRHKTGIMSSRSIRPNQRVKVLVQGVGVFGSTVVDSNDRYLVVSMPVGARLPPGFQWKGARVSIYFWRQEDAGYVFDAYVLEDLRIRNIPVLQIGHSESLLRTQKRKSLRMRSRVPSYLYLLKRLEGAYEKPERVPGMKCVVQDLSEDGAAVLIGGKAKVGLLVKVQFWIGNDQMVLSGTVRGADYVAEKNQSVLHIEAIKPSARMRNLIRSHVYNLRSEDTPVTAGPKLDDKAFSG